MRRKNRCSNRCSSRRCGIRTFGERVMSPLIVPVVQPVDSSSWVQVYPSYLNGSLPLAMGRRISKLVAIDNPSIEELRDACSALNLEFIVEDKLYPKDFLVRGRVRVKTTCKHKKDLLIKMAEKIRNLRTSSTSASNKKPSKK
jgi:signal recognition particle subunit SEC65